MKKKKKKQLPPPELPSQPSEPSYSLEDILQEFGGENAAPEASEASAVSADPALQSPIPRHHTWDDDPDTQRYQPTVEEMPQRQLPNQDAPEEAPMENASPGPDILATPIERSAQPTGPMNGPAGAPSMSVPAPPQRRQRKPRPENLSPEASPREERPQKEQPQETRSKEKRPKKEYRNEEYVQEAPPRRETPPQEARPPKQPPVQERPAAKPHRPKAAPKPRAPKPIVTPEAQFRQAQQERRHRTARLIFCVLFTLCNLVLGFFHAQGLLDTYENQKLLPIGQLLLLLLCVLCAYDVLADGLRQVLRPGFSFNTLVVMEVLASLVDGYYATTALRCTYCPLVCLLLCCALWSLLLRNKTVTYTMEPARHTTGELALMREPNVFQKLPGVLRGKGNLTEFLQENSSTASPQRLLDGYCVVVALFSLLTAGLTCKGDVPTFFQYWVITLLAGTPLLGTITWTRPWAILSRRLQDRGAALYGWAGACRLRGKLAVPVSDSDLFPKDNLKLNGVKFFGGQSPDRVVAYGAAVLSAAGSGLTPLFNEQMELRNARRYAVTSLRRYEAGGVGAEIGGESVLVGSLRFVQSMGVEMPAGTRVSQAVYVAINGDLAGVFAIHYGVTRGAAEGLGALTASRGVTPVVTAGDFIISEPFLRSKFRVNTARLKIPPLTARAELTQKTCTAAAQPCVLLREDRFPAMALAISGARALCTAVWWGTLVDLAGGLMGMIIMAVLANLAASGVMSLVNLGLFLLIWAIPSLLLSGWPRNI